MFMRLLRLSMLAVVNVERCQCWPLSMLAAVGVDRCPCWRQMEAVLNLLLSLAQRWYIPMSTN